MRYLLVLMLAGCSYQAATGPESFDAAKYEPVCARQCLAGYSQCVGGGQTYNSMASNSAYIACSANTKQCLSTCPAK
jgi:hypothetical protein